MTPIRYKTQHGNRHGLLVKTTRSKVYVILIEDNMHIRKLPREEERFIQEIASSLKQVKRQLRQFAKQHRMDLSRETTEALRA